MAYPEKGASYRNKPAWMDRAVAGEKRAEGGGLLPEFEGAAEDSKEDLQNAMRHGSYEKGFNAGDYKGSQRGPTPTNASNLKFYRKHGDTQAEAVKNSLKYKSGGRVRRADGGPLIDSKGRTLENPDNDFTTNSPPARLVEAGSSHAAQDAREQAAARTRRTRAMPDSFPVGGPPKRAAGGRVRRRAEGGITMSDMMMGPQDAKPTDPTISAEDVKTWGTPDNARAAARAREYAKENPYANRDKDAREHMGRGIGQSIGFKRGGTAKREDGGRTEMNDQSDIISAAQTQARNERFNMPRRAIPMPTVEQPDTGDRMEGTPSESNKPSFLRGKKPL